MKKLLTLIVLVTLCYSQDIFIDKCLPNQTNCYVSSSLLCCDHSNAVCCSSGKHCCPNGYNCSEDGLTCNKKSDLFLSNEPDYSLSMELKGWPTIKDLSNCLYDFKPAASNFSKAIKLWSRGDKNSINEAKKYITLLVKDIDQLGKDCSVLIDKILN